jgi:hypothetical protein
MSMRYAHAKEQKLWKEEKWTSSDDAPELTREFFRSADVYKGEKVLCLVLRSEQRRQVYAVCASLTACERLEGRRNLMLRDASHLWCDAPEHEGEARGHA